MPPDKPYSFLPNADSEPPVSAQTRQDQFAYTARMALLRKAVSGWPRRGHRLLELNCGQGEYLEQLWHAGFDVTGNERDNCLRALALEKRLDVVGGSPALLPYEDESFDYVVCLHGLEDDQTRGEVIAEAFRLAGLGVLMGFANARSLQAIFSRVHRTRMRCTSPGSVAALAKLQNKAKRSSWLSNLLLPAGFWRDDALCSGLNLISLPFPLGAFCLLKVDFAPSVAGNMLLLPAQGTLRSPRRAQSGVCTQKHRMR